MASATSTMSTIDHCSVTSLFGIFLETNMHENLRRLRHSIRQVLGIDVLLNVLAVLPRIPQIDEWQSLFSLTAADKAYDQN